MAEERKRKLIRFLNRFDYLQGKTMRLRWNPTTLVYDKYEEGDELSRMTGKALDRELRRQLLYTLPSALFLLLLVAALIRFIRFACQ